MAKSKMYKYDILPESCLDLNRNKIVRVLRLLVAILSRRLDFVGCFVETFVVFFYNTTQEQ